MPDLAKMDLNGLTDQEIQDLMDLGIIPDQQDALKQQMATAEQLRYHNQPEMRQGQRVSTAANPLEFAVNAWQGIQAGKDLNKLKDQQAELLRKQSEGRGLFYKKLRGEPPPDPMLGEEYVS